MECPICYHEIRPLSPRTIRLECGHSLCLNCAKTWIVLRRPTCPICRQETHYFSRNTRSKSAAIRLKIKLDNSTDLIQDYATTSSLPVWRRPDMQQYWNLLKERLQRDWMDNPHRSREV